MLQFKKSQHLKVLLWKILILRKRRWLITLLEIFVPITVFWVVIYYKNLTPEEAMEIVYDTNPIEYIRGVHPNNYKLAFTPENNFTSTLMNIVFTNLTALGCQVMLKPSNNESSMVEWLRLEYLDDESNKHLKVIPTGIGVIFSSSEESESLNYTIRTTTQNIDTSDRTLYGQYDGNGNNSYYLSGFTAVQITIDQAYLLLKHNLQVPESLFSWLPMIANMRAVDLVDSLFPIIMCLGFTFVLPSLIREIVDEKTSGIKEIMQIMGLQTWMGWISWAIYTLLIYIPVTFVITCLLTSDIGSGASVHSGIFVLWLLFILFIFAVVPLVFTISTFFMTGSVAMIAGELIWFGVTIILDTLVVEDPDTYGIWLNLLTCFWPCCALVWAIKSINVYYKNGMIWTWSHMFDGGTGGGRVSVGLAMIMLSFDIVLYSFLTYYLDHVNPGPYGRPKPLTFMCQCFKEKEYDPGSTCESGEKTGYETAPENVNVGIRIQNLSKTFHHGKVTAVRNVDLDIYEGSITVLLGHNGAGKSTTMSILSGFFMPTSGKVIVNGKNIFEDMTEFRANLGLCPQHNLLFDVLTVIEHLILFGMLKGLTMSKAKSEGMALLKSFNMEFKEHKLVNKLSGGMKRKLCLAIALMGNPKVLLLDEPTSGLDPESRRQVWDVLLKFRRERIILITTHFMEEADVLGDRVAIMNHGEVSCYGSPLYLKKVFGKGYQLNISKLDLARPKAIRRVVVKRVRDAAVDHSSKGQIKFTVSDEDYAQFPKLFNSLDRRRDQLGITAVGMSWGTLEDVFLRVTGEDTQQENMNGNSGLKISGSKYHTESGWNIVLLQVKALLYMRSLQIWRSWFTTLIFIATLLVLMVIFILKLMMQDQSLIQNKLQISVAKFQKTHLTLASQDRHLITALEKIVAAEGTPLELISPHTDVNQYATEKINENFIDYETEMIGLIQGDMEAYCMLYYSNYFAHSFPLMLNIWANSQLHFINSSSSIATYVHPLTFKEPDSCDKYFSSPKRLWKFPIDIIPLSVGLVIFCVSFLSFPLKERVSGGKHLQMMTGISPLLYWTVFFVCDFTVYLITLVPIIGILYALESDRILSASGYIGLLVLVFLLVGCSAIAFVYFFSFLLDSALKASVVFVIVNLILGTCAGSFFFFLDGVYKSYGVWRCLLSFNPIFCATSGLVHLFAVMYVNGSCLGCGKECNYLDPLTFLDPGYWGTNPHGINNFVIFLAFDTIFYFGLVMMIEYGVFTKIKICVTHFWINIENELIEEDSDVVLEKRCVISSPSVQVIAGYSSQLPILQVNNLAKKYGRGPAAVKGITFQVEQGECLGLLGVNGAGKSSTFNMLTGQNLPDRGDATVNKYSLLKSRKQFLSRIGYCPQFDAVSPQLTARETLLIYAWLRGIPTSSCQSEVSKWIEIMGLTEYADRKCKSYSGGNKRKLSTAVAFLGSPAVVFLDEPTTGVDPASRRRLWFVIGSAQTSGLAVVLTSHSMEECEAVCTRITIMAQGRMMCIGSALHLKQKFCQGFTVQVKLLPTQFQPEELDALKKAISIQFPASYIKDEHVGLLHYHIPDATLKLSKIFSAMELIKNSHNIVEHYMVSDTSLEQVFMSFADSRVEIPEK